MRGTKRILRRTLGQSSIDRVRINVTQMVHEISLVSNQVFSKAGLPDRQARSKMFSNLVRRAAFHQLHGLFKGRGMARRQNNVQMVRHNDVTVNLIETSVPIFDHFLFNDGGEVSLSK